MLFLFYRKWIFSMNDVHMTFCTYLPIPSDPFNLSVYSVISFLKCQIACCSKCTSKKHDLITGCMRVTLYIGWRTYLACFHCHPLPLIETVSAWSAVVFIVVKRENHQSLSHLQWSCRWDSHPFSQLYLCSCQKFPIGKRFYNVITGTMQKHIRLIIRSGFRNDNNHRYMTYFLQQLLYIDARQHQIQRDQIRCFLFKNKSASIPEYARLHAYPSLPSISCSRLTICRSSSMIRMVYFINSLILWFYFTCHLQQKN